MDLYKKTYRVSAETKKAVEEIAAQENCTETAVFENAIRYYKDYLYMQTDGAFINESVKRTFLASVNLRNPGSTTVPTKCCLNWQSNRP